MKPKKITLATIKKFIKENQHELYKKVISHFDGMVDCVMPVNGEWQKLENPDVNNFGFVGCSRDYFAPYKDSAMTGYEVYNCCGKFLIAIIKEK